MRCTPTIDKNAAWWSKPDIQQVRQGHEDRVCNTNDLQTFIYFTGSYAQLPSKSPVLPLEVIVPGWLGDRCQVAPPQPIHHAKQKGKADLSLSDSQTLFLCCFLLLCLFLVTSNMSWSYYDLWQSSRCTTQSKIMQQLVKTVHAIAIFPYIYMFIYSI